MSGFVVARDRYGGQVIRREFGWAGKNPRRAAQADFTCAVRCLALEAAKAGIGPGPSPALLDVAGPRTTTIRSAAGLTHLHAHHPQRSGFHLDVKDSCSRLAMRRRTMSAMSGLGSCSSQLAYRKKPVGTTSQK
jgi:hypothetical protein